MVPRLTCACESIHVTCHEGGGLLTQSTKSFADDDQPTVCIHNRAKAELSDVMIIYNSNQEPYIMRKAH